MWLRWAAWGGKRQEAGVAQPGLATRRCEARARSCRAKRHTWSPSSLAAAPSRGCLSTLAMDSYAHLKCLLASRKHFCEYRQQENFHTKSAYMHTCTSPNSAAKTSTADSLPCDRPHSKKDHLRHHRLSIVSDSYDPTNAQYLCTYVRADTVDLLRSTQTSSGVWFRSSANSHRLRTHHFTKSLLYLMNFIPE